MIRKSIEIISILIVFFLLTGCGHSTLEGAIKNVWHSNVQILNKNEGAVIFKSKNHITCNSYKVKNGHYYYTPEGENGEMSVNSIKQDFTLMGGKFYNGKSYICGTVKNPKQTTKITISYLYKEGQNYKGTYQVTNNTFIGRFPFQKNKIPNASKLSSVVITFYDNNNIVIKKITR